MDLEKFGMKLNNATSYRGKHYIHVSMTFKTTNKETKTKIHSSCMKGQKIIFQVEKKEQTRTNMRMCMTHFAA